MPWGLWIDEHYDVPAFIVSAWGLFSSSVAVAPVGSSFALTVNACLSGWLQQLVSCTHHPDNHHHTERWSISRPGHYWLNRQKELSQISTSSLVVTKRSDFQNQILVTRVLKFDRLKREEFSCTCEAYSRFQNATRFSFQIEEELSKLQALSWKPFWCWRTHGKHPQVTGEWHGKKPISDSWRYSTREKSWRS